MMQKPAKITIQKDVEEVIGLVQGILPDSKNEWYVSLALDKLKIDYQFQYPIYGGTQVRGGQVIDFLVYLPYAQPVFVQGEYWHNKRTESEDIIKQEAAKHYFGREPILLMGSETDTKDAAYKTVVEKLGL